MNYVAIAPDRNITFKNYGPFINCSSKMNNIKTDNGKNLDIVIPMYIFIEYSNNYAKKQEVYGNILETNLIMI